MSTTAVPAGRTATGVRPLLRAFAAGLLAAVVLALAVYAVARGVGDPMTVTPPGQATQQVPVGAVIGATLMGALAGLGLALLARLTPRPRLLFLVVTVVGLVLSFASPLSSAQQTSTAWWLNLMHVVVFAAVVLPLARLLPDRKA